jgi:uncharacterized protein
MVMPIAVSSFVPLTVFIASILGSLHCAGMCGPIQTLVASNTKTSITYHFGRLISYATLGAIAGKFGESLLSPLQSPSIASLVLVFFRVGLHI